MKLFNVATALALALMSDSAFATKESTASNVATSDDYKPTFSCQDALEETTSTTSSEGTRYLVKYKKNSSQYKANLETARIQAQAKKQGGKFLTGGPSISADTHLLTHGKFLPNQNVEIAYFRSEKEKTLFEERNDVEYIEADHKICLMAESTPYGITKVRALDVSDDNVSNRKVCILDTGFDINHPDLTSDTDVVTGYDGSNSAGPSPWTFDGHGHGTHVAGTIAAIGANDEGVVGVNRNGKLKLHIVKVFGDNGTWGWQSTLIAAVEECVNANANVISMSLGGGGFSQTESDTYDRILNGDDILLVAAAGNGGNNAPYSYPASYNSVMSVAATDSNDNVAGFSQKNDQVDIAAPGVAVLSTLPNGTYAKWNGTSMACPHVSGIAALIWSHHTTKTAVEIRAALESSATDLGAVGRDDVYGHGLVRADKALEFLNSGFTPDPTQSPTPAPPCTDNPDGWYDIDGSVYNCAWYAQGSNCAVYGDTYASEGITANMACCACGGGSPDGPETSNPTKSPSFGPTPSTKAPAASLSSNPSQIPTKSVSVPPSSRPTRRPTASPSRNPTVSPSRNPTVSPSRNPTVSPSRNPTVSPSRNPTASPTEKLSVSLSPTPEEGEGVATCGSTVFVGSNECPSHEETIDYTTLRDVRCCSDTYLGQPWKKKNQCSVWGATEKINDGCSGKINFNEAMAYCADADGRLCTSEELANDCTRGTGCGYDRAMIWSSTAEL